MIVAVVGKGRDCPKAVREVAYRVGYDLACLGHTVLSGGLGGVMEASARGARAGLGEVISLIPNRWKGNGLGTVVIHTGVPPAIRNVVMGSACDAMLACWGSHGTMQELAVALDRDVPVAQVACDCWPDLKRLEPEEVRAWLTSLTPAPERGRLL